MADKEKHLELAGVVKSVHAKLRTQFKKGDEIDNIWEKHCQDKVLLTEYADAMHELATQVWTSNNTETRIDWCKKTCLKYFYHGGLQKVQEKLQRRIQFHQQADELSDSQKSKKCADDSKQSTSNHSSYFDTQCEKVACKVNVPDYLVNNSGQENNLICIQDNVPGGSNRDLKKDNLDEQGSCQNSPTTVSNYLCTSNEEAGSDTDHTDEMPDRHLLDERKALYSKYGPAQYNKIILPFTERIRLLDVGSCYNPFQQYKEFISVAIDISPAVKTVYYCDFLHLDTMNPLQLASDTIDSIINCLTDPIEKLPEESFHTVVFSLLLEYFPSTYQRWICCEKAHKLLMLNGLLIIITPDSHHQNKNAPMMKSWKKAIESMGFVRWRYEKQQHLHCMAFRKVVKTEPVDTLIRPDATSPDMLYIPQDFKDENCVEDSEGWLQNEMCENDNFSVIDGFSELTSIDEL